MNKLTLIVFSLPLISACSPSMPELPDMPSLPDMSNIIPDVSLPTPYRANVYQGSVLERFKVNQLKLGMSKAQVQDLIGSPSVTDPFHNNQWDYINHSTLHQADDIRYRLVLTFKEDALIDINTKGIETLAPLTEEEKALEEKRLADEKAKLEAQKKAKIKAQKIAQEKAQLAAKAKAEAEAIAEQKAIEEKRLADEKAKLEAQKKAQEANKPWYQFW